MDGGGGDIEELEQLCTQLYQAADPTQRQIAEKGLLQFSLSPDCLAKCRLLLERGSSPYAQMLAVTTLTKLVSCPPGGGAQQPAAAAQQQLTMQQRIDVRDYILQYLCQRGANLASFVVQGMLQLFACITKLGWLDEAKDGSFPFRNVTQQLREYVMASSDGNCVIGIQLLAQLVSEVNHISETDSYGNLLRHRKIASSFRDNQLYDIFVMACGLLEKGLKVWREQPHDPSLTSHLLNHLLRLAYNCLSFDFIGTSPDESSDDLCTVQIPTCWRSIFIEPLSSAGSSSGNVVSSNSLGSSANAARHTGSTGASPTGTSSVGGQPTGRASGPTNTTGECTSRAQGASEAGCGTVQLFFELYQCLPSPMAGLALSCAVQIASLRRSLFNLFERARFLAQLVDGVKKILENPQGLSEQSSCHEFCRLLARLKSNYQLTELVKLDNYADTIRLISEFTVTCIGMPQFGANSLHYLLSLWQRMVASMPYIRTVEPHMLEVYAPQIVHAYVTSRLDIAAKVVRQNLEDPLDDVGMVQQQLDKFSVICRCEYDKTCSLLVQLFDNTVAVCQQGSQEKAVSEAQLAWLVYIIGAAIGGRISFSSSDEQDEMDGQMVCRVLQLMNITTDPAAAAAAQGNANGAHQGLLPMASEKLELAMLSFFEQFRRIYVGDQVTRTSAVYVALTEVLGLTNDTAVLSVFVRKVITNLKCWGACEQITKRTLQLLSDLSVGYSSVRKLVKLDEVQFLLNHHSAEHFPFLGYSSGAAGRDTRCRTTFYTSLARMLLIELGEDEERFERFMAPLTAAMETIGSRLMLSSTESAHVGLAYNVEETKRGLIGLARDLRGLSMAFNTKVSYMMLFDWIFPKYMAVLHRAIELWFHEPRVTTPVLKLMAELVQNRSQRLQFDVSSPNGILLFRETSSMMVTYGSRLLSIGEVPKEELYQMKLKGISICFSMLRSSLCGAYVNFGMFKLYGDSALDDALNTFVKMLISIPQDSLLDYRKLSLTYYILLECLTQDHINFIVKLDPQVFLYIISSVSDGLTALDAMVCTGCCAILDHIVSYVFKFLNKSKLTDPAEVPTCVQVLERHPEILQQMLATLLNVIMWEDCKNQWSMSRPLLGLILLNSGYFRQLTMSLVEAQPPEKRAAMMGWFQALMQDIDRNLLTRNRDKFTMNLSVFRRDINDCLKIQQQIPSGRPGNGQNAMSNTIPFNDMMI